MILASAPTTSPASNNMISPIVKSLLDISIVFPSRMTRVCGVDNCFRLFNEFWAFMLCIVPKIAFMVITAKITIVLSTSPLTIEIIAAMIKIMTNKSLN